MPIYAYRCSACGHAKDVLQKMSDPLLSTCPACAAEAFTKQLTAAGFQLKGSGWYVTDFREGNKAPAKPGDAPGEGGADKPAETVADKASDKAADKAAEKPTDKSADKPADKPSDKKGAEKPAASAAPAAPAAAPAAPSSSAG